MNDYYYHPLPPVQEIGRTPPFSRLLIIAAGRHDDPLSGSMIMVQVDSAPRYEALSYTWGEEKPQSCIFIDGRRLPIRPNLEGALRSLRLPDLARRLWVDAICINQSSPVECSRQVGYMRQVYQHAARVIVWLGPRSRGVEEAFELAGRLAEIRESVVEPALSRETVDQETIQKIYASPYSNTPPDSMRYLMDLLGREYFNRSWCLQEVIACSWAVARCGDLEMPFFDIIATIPVVLRVNGTIFDGKTFEFWNGVYLRRRQPEGWLSKRATHVEGSMGPLETLLSGTRDFKATDRRDKIFSLLGISDEGLQPVLALTQIMTTGDEVPWPVKLLRRAATGIIELLNSVAPDGHDVGRPSALTPDYKKAWEDVYINVARFFVRKSPRMLDMLGQVQHNDDPTCGPLPSWVPKWYEARSCSVLSVGCFLAGLCDGHFSYFAVVHDNPLRGMPVRPKILSLDGYHVDHVQTVSEVLIYDLEDTVTVEHIWSQVFNFPLFPRPTVQYRGHEPLDLAFCLTLMLSTLGAGIGLLTGVATGMLWSDVQFDKDVCTRRARADAARFLVHEAEMRSGNNEPYSDLLPLAVEGNVESFMRSVRSLAHNRRVYVTQKGYLGIGPKMMKPGDEVCVLFGGRLPFILRPAGGHHIFIGDTYLHDDSIMWGITTKGVRYNQSNIPVRTFELH